MSYQLKENELTYCHGVWNPKTKTYRDSTPKEVVQCCIDNCKGYTSYCFNQCHGRYGPEGTAPSYKNHKKCHSQCQQLLTDCKNTCFDYPSEHKDASSLEKISKNYRLERNDFTEHSKDNPELYVVYIMLVILFLLAIYILTK